MFSILCTDISSLIITLNISSQIYLRVIYETNLFHFQIVSHPWIVNRNSLPQNKLTLSSSVTKIKVNILNQTQLIKRSLSNIYFTNCMFLTSFLGRIQSNILSAKLKSRIKKIKTCSDFITRATKNRENEATCQTIQRMTP